MGDLVSELAGVANFTRYYQQVESLVIAETQGGHPVSFTENGIFAADSGFFNIFTFRFIHGHHTSALAKSNAIVLTKSTSQKYFGDANPLGRTLVIRVPWGAETLYEVTGVIADIPKRSRFRFDFLAHRSQFSEQESWDVPDYSTYVLVNEKAAIPALERMLAQSIKHVPHLRSTNKKVVLSLQSIQDILLSNTERLLVAIGIFIFVISWVNYINQIIAQSFWRRKEIGILRIMGATRANLNTQFIVESGITCLVSLTVVIVLYASLEHHLQSLTNGHLLPLIGDPTSVNHLFIGIFVVGIVAAAAIPATILLSANFEATLRNGYSANARGVGLGLRKALVAIQLSISTVLMISLFVITSQLKYARAKDKGFNVEDVLVVKAPLVKDTTWQVKRKTLELFKERCAKLPFVKSIASSTTIPGEEYRQETYLRQPDENIKALVHQNGIDEEFFALYDIEFVSGHNFVSDARAKNSESIILNESAARDLGITDFQRAIDTKIVDEGEPDLAYNLIGIVRDYHQTSLKNQMRPMAFRYNVFRGHCSLKISGAVDAKRSQEQLSAIEAIWEQTYPDASFNHFLLESKFAAEQEKDESFGNVFEFFTALSVVITCMGLFGLSLLISTKREREIGIRKTFGASSGDILLTFLRGYAGPLGLSVVIGSPLACVLMDMWLRNYAYRIDIGFGIISLALVCLIAIFLCTVAYHTIKSSVANPVSILRS